MTRCALPRPADLPASRPRSRPLKYLLVTALVTGVLSIPPASAAVLEVPSDGGDASGISYFSGWKCAPNDDISVIIDGHAPIPVATNVRRLDTATVCNNDGRNGFIGQFNFSLLGDGAHSVRVRQGGVDFAHATFYVTTFGTPFMSGAAATYSLPDFPSTGQSAIVEWVEGTQSFVVVGKHGDRTSEGALVRFRNQLLCEGGEFVSTLSANGQAWESFSGAYSQYQEVGGRFMSGMTSTIATCGSLSYEGAFLFVPGRRYLLSQKVVDGQAFLAQVDEGPIAATGDAAEGAGPPLAIVYGAQSCRQP